MTGKKPNFADLPEQCNPCAPYTDEVWVEAQPVGRAFGASSPLRNCPMKIGMVGVDSPQTVATRFSAVMKGEARDKFVTFASTALLFRTLTESRRQILRFITGVGAQSRHEAAWRIGCDTDALQDDVRMRLETRVLECTVEGEIVFPYDAVHVDFTLTATHRGSEASR